MKNDDIKQMLHSINKKFFRLLGHKNLMVHIESEIRHFDDPATCKQTENCLVDPEFHRAGSLLSSLTLLQGDGQNSDRLW